MAQTCNCSNTYQYKQVCVVCGEPWTDDECVSDEVEKNAQYFYKQHLENTGMFVLDCMWDQCTAEYRNAWRLIAVADLDARG